MEPLMNEARVADDEVRFETHADEFLALGFIPAYLDFGTQTFHAARWSPLLIAGFERNGFFYTRAAAAKAVVEWSCTR